MQTFLKITTPTPSDSLSSLKYIYNGYKFTIQYPLIEAKRWIIQRNELDDFSPHYGPLMKAIGKVSALKNKKVIVIYSKSHGAKFKNFPVGKDKEINNVLFVDLRLDQKDFFLLDSHMNKLGHERVGWQLAAVLKNLP